MPPRPRYLVLIDALIEKCVQWEREADKLILHSYHQESKGFDGLAIRTEGRALKRCAKELKNILERMASVFGSSSDG